jgi:arylsulfatase
MKRSILLIIAAFLLVFSARVQAQTAPQKPNVVIILADDMGYSDLGCWGSEISTPNIDRLAAQGVRMTQFYNSARCCPSRAALLTGVYNHQAGIGSMIDKYATWIRNAAHSDNYIDHLSRHTPTMAEVMHTAGYRTLMCGKWHLGDRENEWPAARGFDRSFALIPGAMNYFGGETKGPRSPMALDDKKFVPPHDGFYSTDAFGDHAIEFLDEAKKMEKPFFLYLAFNAPHWPLQAPEEDIAKYKGKYDAGWQPIREARYKRMVELGILDGKQQMAPMDRGQVKPWNELSDEKRAEWSRRMEIYAAQITRMDLNVGRVMDELKKLGVDQNTLVLFISDNGGAAEDPNHPGDAPLGTRDSFKGYARPWATVSNTPFRFHKVTAYEGGISTPLIAYWPAGISEKLHNTMVREPGHLIDLMPTVMELTGATRPSVEDEPALEGQSIAGILRGEKISADRSLFWEHEGNRAARVGKWKLVALANKPWELYDVESDRVESHDLASSQPEKVKELEAAYNAWAKKCGVVPWDQIEPKRPEKK